MAETKVTQNKWLIERVGTLVHIKHLDGDKIVCDAGVIKKVTENSVWTENENTLQQIKIPYIRKCFVKSKKWQNKK